MELRRPHHQLQHLGADSRRNLRVHRGGITCCCRRVGRCIEWFGDLLQHRDVLLLLHGLVDALLRRHVRKSCGVSRCHHHDGGTDDDRGSDDNRSPVNHCNDCCTDHCNDHCNDFECSYDHLCLSKGHKGHVVRYGRIGGTSHCPASIRQQLGDCGARNRRVQRQVDLVRDSEGYEYLQGTIRVADIQIRQEVTAEMSDSMP